MKSLLILIGIALLQTAWADGDIKSTSENMIASLGGLNDLVLFICYATGIAMILGALVQYREHRLDPARVPLGRVFIVLLTGIVLCGIPLLAQYAEGNKVIIIGSTDS